MMQLPVESPDEVANDDHEDGKAKNGGVPQLQYSAVIMILLFHIPDSIIGL